jgi:Fe-S oxidoreductase
LRKFNIPHKFEFTSIITALRQWIREGKLKVNSDWNKDLKIKFTVPGPLQHRQENPARRDGRRTALVVKTVVGEENFVDMVPCGVNNYCCGGGGGALQGGFTEQRRAYGKVKFDQVMATGANMSSLPATTATARSKTWATITAAASTYHLWTIMCLAMGILGENERSYLGPDLAWAR